ncbi:PAS domain-containing protein, partial [Streptomyces sp. 2MCAF27]
GWNEGAHKLLGHPDSAVVGRPASRLLADGAAGGLPVPLEPLTRWSGELTLRHRDGRPLRVALLAHPRRTADGGAEWLLVSPLDRAGPTAADDELVRAAFTQGPCTMAVFDARLLVRWVNTYMEGVVDFGQAQVRGLRVSDVVPGTRGAEIERMMRLVLDTGLPQYLSLPPGHGRAAWSILLAPVLGDDGRV